MLKTAQNWGYVCEGVNFSKLALPSRTISEQAPSFSEEEARSIIAEAKGQYRVMFAIAAMSGLRVGEILALQLSGFDFPNRLLAVRRSVWRGKLQTPKTINSQAILPLPDALAGIVKEHAQNLNSAARIGCPISALFHDLVQIGEIGLALACLDRLINEHQLGIRNAVVHRMCFTPFNDPLRAHSPGLQRRLRAAIISFPDSRTKLAKQ
jgi:integrase